MKPRGRKVLARSLIVLLVTCSLVLVGFGLAQQNGTIQFAIGAGVLSSLLASTILGFFTTRSLGGQTELVDKLIELEKAAQSRLRYGTTLVDEKYSHKPEYWNSLCDSTNHRLLLIGHALSKWVQPIYKESFLDAIERVVRSGGDFCIIILSPTGDGQSRIRETRGIDYGTRIDTTLRALGQLHARLPKRFKGRLDVRFLPQDEEPLYMAVITDSSVEHSPYYMRNDTKTAPHASYSASSLFADAIIDDFQSIRPACERVDLTKYEEAQ